MKEKKGAHVACSGCVAELASPARRRPAPPPRLPLRLVDARSAPLHAEVGPLELNAGVLRLSAACGREAALLRSAPPPARSNLKPVASASAPHARGRE